MLSSLNLFRLCMMLVLAFTVFGLNKVHNDHELKIKEPEVVAKEVDEKQLQCLADNIYHEAGSESIEGKAAVARVVLNRIMHGGFGNTPCKVIYQSHRVKHINDETSEMFWKTVCQFSWVCENKKVQNKNTERYQSSLQVAYDVLAYDAYSDLLPKSVLFFHNKTIVNTWPHEVVKVIGNHIFYKKKPHVKRNKTNGIKS